MNRIKKRVTNWKWWVALTVSVPLTTIFAIVGMPLFAIGIAAVAAAEWIGMGIITVLHGLHVFAHGWAERVKYDGVLGVFTIAEKNND